MSPFVFLRISTNSHGRKPLYFQIVQLKVNGYYTGLNCCLGFWRFDSQRPTVGGAGESGTFYIQKVIVTSKNERMSE